MSDKRPQSERGPRDRGVGRGRSDKPPLRVFTTTLWEYPSQHFDSWPDSDGNGRRATKRMQGGQAYEGATGAGSSGNSDKVRVVTSSIRCGSGTTLDVARELGRRALRYDRPVQITSSEPTAGPVARRWSRRLCSSTPTRLTSRTPTIRRASASSTPPTPTAARRTTVRYPAPSTDLQDHEGQTLHGPVRQRLLAEARPGSPGGRAGVFMPIGFEISRCSVPASNPSRSSPLCGRTRSSDAQLAQGCTGRQLLLRG